MAITPQTFSAAGDNTSDATFRAWGLALSTALQAVGSLTKTTDTGQVNWATVTTPVGSSAVQGYEIYRFNDALQSTAPIFIRFEYGSGASQSRPQINVKVGTVTDGAGNFSSLANTGVSVTTSTACLSTSGIGTAFQCYVNADPSSLLVAMWPTSTSGGGAFYIERARAADGTVIGDGVLIGWMPMPTTGTPSTWQSLLLHNQTAQPGATTSAGWIAHNGQFAATGIKDSVMYTLPLFTGATPRLGAPSVLLVGVMTADLSNGAQFVITHYGTSCTFLATGGRIGSASLSTDSASTVMSLALRIT